MAAPLVAEERVTVVASATGVTVTLAVAGLEAAPPSSVAV